MQNTSRRNRREARLVYIAEKGLFKATLHLFKSECRRMRKLGFTVPAFTGNEKRAEAIEVSWEKAFSDGAPPVVLDYVYGVTNTFPKTDNWAQELYVIAARAQFENGTK